MEEKAKYWALSRPYMVSLTIKGYFIFRFNSPEDKAYILGQSRLQLGKGRKSPSYLGPLDKKKQIGLPLLMSGYVLKGCHTIVGVKISSSPWQTP